MAADAFIIASLITLTLSRDSWGADGIADAIKAALVAAAFLSMVRSFAAANGALLSEMWTFAHRFVDMVMS